MTVAIIKYNAGNTASVTNAPDGGAVFTMRFPINAPATPPVRPSVPAPAT